MRISDWSSDVCSSDLFFGKRRHLFLVTHDFLALDQFETGLGKIVRHILDVSDPHNAFARRTRTLLGRYVLNGIETISGFPKRRTAEEDRVARQSRQGRHARLPIEHIMQGPDQNGQSILSIRTQGGPKADAITQPA